MDELETEILEFVAKETGFNSKKLNLDSRLFHDLGMDGIDGIELIEALKEKFNVNLDGIDYTRHFGPEAGPKILHFVGVINSFQFVSGIW